MTRNFLLIVTALAAAIPAMADTPSPPRTDWGEQVVVLETEWFRAELSNFGGTLRSFLLKGDDRYVRTEAEADAVMEGLAATPQLNVPRGKFSPGPLDMVTTWDWHLYPFSLRFEDTDFAELYQKDPTYQVTEATPTSVTFVWPHPEHGVKTQFSVERRWEVDTSTPDHRHVLRATIRFRNAGEREIRGAVRLAITGFEPMPRPQGMCGGMFGPRQDHMQAACGSNEEHKLADHLGLSVETGLLNQASFVGINSRYFLLAAVPDGTMVQCLAEADSVGVINVYGRWQLDLRAASSVGQPGLQEFSFAAFLGPKDFDELKAMDGARETGVRRTIDFNMFGKINLAILCEPMLYFMRAVYALIPSWAVSIILLTLVVKLLTLYWSWKSLVQARKMQQLKPKMDAIKARYKDDNAAMQKAMMELYKREKVNPFGGCLPMLLQMPIWIALYMTIYGSVDLFHAPLFLWVTDLSAQDPYYVLPILLGVLMFVQQKMTPSVGDPAQAKVMLWLMPIMFTWFMLFLPSGLVFYILVNTLLSIGQQYLMNRRFAVKGA